MSRLLLALGLSAAIPSSLAQYPLSTEVNADGTLTVYRAVGGGQGEGCPTGTLVIPDTIDGREVTRIGDRAFSACSGLTNVTIPDGVTHLGDGAFAGTGLISITIPGSVNRVPFAAFSGCTSLTSVTIGFGVTSIETWAFDFCTNLTSLTIPDSVTNIYPAAFDGCPFRDVLFNTSRTMLVKYPADRSGNYRIPDGVTRIGGGAFESVKGLTAVFIPDSVISIGRLAFAGCTALSTLTLGEGVATLEDSAFLSCSGLTSVTIPDGVISIGLRAFMACSNLTSVTIPARVSRLGEAAFGDCPELRHICFAGDAPTIIDTEGNPTSTEEVFGAPEATICYLPGTRGWGPAFAGRRTAPWIRPDPTILAFGGGFGSSPEGFGFVVSWATNRPVVVEASADPGAGWLPISTNTLTDGRVRFTDPSSKNQSARFYRVRGP